MKKTLYLIFLLQSFVVLSQNKELLLGKIITATPQSESINIINLTQGIGTINDAAGFFQIRAKPRDTIVFSSVQYQQETHIVTKKDLEQANVSVTLKIKVNQLDEITISPYDLSGEAKEDIKNIKTYEDNLPMFNAKALDLTPFVHEKGAATVRNTTVDHTKNVTAFNFIAAGRMVASLFNKKDAKKSKQIAISKISDFYSEGFLVSELKIPETELYNFLDYLNEQTETKKILKSGNELKILEYLITQSKTFNNDTGKD